MKLPSYPQKGKPVEDTVRGMIDYLRSITVRGIAGGRVVTTANGTTLIPPKQKAAGSGGSSNHPFKLTGTTSAGDYLLHVFQGACTVNGWAWTSSTVYGQTVELVPSIGSGTLLSDSVGIGDVGAGYLTLAAPVSGTTTYGIWLHVAADNNFSTVSIYDAIGGIFPNTAHVHFATFSFGSAAVFASSTYTDSSDAADQGLVGGADDKDLAIYLGKVVVDAAGAATITQYRKTDVTISAPLLTSPIVVSADTNDITLGTDGGALYVTP